MTSSPLSDLETSSSPVSHFETTGVWEVDLVLTRTHGGVDGQVSLDFLTDQVLATTKGRVSILGIPRFGNWLDQEWAFTWANIVASNNKIRSLVDPGNALKFKDAA